MLHISLSNSLIVLKTSSYPISVSVPFLIASRKDSFSLASPIFYTNINSVLLGLSLLGFLFNEGRYEAKQLKIQSFL